MHRLLLRRPRIVGRTAVLTFERQPFGVDDFFRRYELAAGEAGGTLERRRAAEIPDTLQIRMAVRGPRQRSRFRLGEGRRGDEHGEGESNRNIHAAHRYSPRLARIARAAAIIAADDFYRPERRDMNASKPANAKNWPTQNTNIHLSTSHRTS